MLDTQSTQPGTESKQVDTPSVLLCTEWAQADTLTVWADIWSQLSGTLFLQGYIRSLLQGIWSAKEDTLFPPLDIAFQQAGT